jgi:hypothetical protein
MNLTSIFRQALEYWDNPSDQELPRETFINSANRCLRQRGLDLELTSDACFFTQKSDTFQFSGPDARETDLSWLDPAPSRIVRVESRGLGSNSEDDWEEETRASHDNWNDIMERGDDNYCAVYGNTPNLTLVTNRDVSALEFRVVYRSMQPNIASLTDPLSVPSIYESVLVYDIALDIGELISNDSPEFKQMKSTKMPYLQGRLEDAIDRIDKWRRSQHGTSVKRRRSFSDRVPTFGVTNRRKFTITF